MSEVWSGLISDNQRLVEEDRGPGLVTVVSGSETDQTYWRQHYASMTRDVFRASGGVTVTSVFERTPKGNFLGTLNAWSEVRQALAREQADPADISLMTMVFGQGRRLSPFTQALGNRKPSFLSPKKARRAAGFLRTADLSNLYSNSLLEHLRESGFRGLVAKWGDEVIIPGLRWRPGEHDFRDVDAVRLVWHTEITEAMAREKEWVVVNEESGLAEFEYARQEAASLRRRLAERSIAGYRIGVNLGSLALSYELLDLACEVFAADLADERKSVDWDPYAWIALFCTDEAQWRAEAEHERRLGGEKLSKLEATFPDFYEKVARLRGALREKKGRPLRVGVLDFGDALWVDIGLHLTLRKTMEALLDDSAVGHAARELFGLPHERDRRGNLIVGSVVPDSASIRDSLIVDSVILDGASVLRRGVVVGGRHRLLHMPEGGSALFCAADSLTFAGDRSVAMLAMTPEVVVPPGGRHTSVFLPQGKQDFVTTEDIWDYSGENYSRPILGNPLSFEEAAGLMSGVDGRELEARQQSVLRGWLG
jgi:hypothetical protein